VLSAEQAEAWLSRVPPGWGVLVRGRAQDIPLAHLRQSSRLRPLGIYVDALEPDFQPPFMLDLLVTTSGVGDPAKLPAIAPRWLVVPGEGASLGPGEQRFAAHGAHGIVCETQRSLEWVFRLALR
jgi:hypothetical protein